MRLAFDDGTLLLEDAPNSVPYADWDDRVDEYRARALHYQDLCQWAQGPDGQATLNQASHTDESLHDDARAYRDLDLTPAVAIEPRDYQQAALAAWTDHDRRGSVVLPTGSGKTFLAVKPLLTLPSVPLLSSQQLTC